MCRLVTRINWNVCVIELEGFFCKVPWDDTCCESFGTREAHKQVLFWLWLWSCCSHHGGPRGAPACGSDLRHPVGASCQLLLAERIPLKKKNSCIVKFCPDYLLRISHWQDAYFNGAFAFLIAHLLFLHSKVWKDERKQRITLQNLQFLFKKKSFSVC